MGGVKEFIRRVQDSAGMVLLQLFTTGMILLSKIVLNQGMFVFALLTYRLLVGALAVLPFALFFERGMWRKLCWLPMVWIFINALLGISMALGFYYYGLRDTTATYSSNFLNLIPIVTFVIAVLCRFERLGIRSRAGKIKIVGTFLCAGGATMVSFLCRGRVLGSIRHIEHQNTASSEMRNQTRGTLFLVACCLSYAFWFISQVKISEVFPYKYWTTVLTCIVGSVQTVVVGIIMNRERVAWKLHANLQLLTIISSGTLNSGATFCLIVWVVARRGPTYPPMFNPLSLVFTMIAESAIFGQEITLGSLLGSIVIIGGLYAFLWGKRKETAPKSENQNGEIRSKAIKINHINLQQEVNGAKETIEIKEDKTFENV